MKQKQDPDAFIPVTSCTQSDRGNMVAYCLTKYGLRMQGKMIWAEEFFDFVKDYIINDVYGSI